MATLALLFLVALIWQADASFDCRRPQQPCQNSGVCIFTNPFCTACGANEGYDCGVVTAQIVAGCTDCLNGGTCFDPGAGNECYCADTHYGATCDLRRLNVFCEVDKMTIGVNPHGDFTNGIAYIEGKRTEPTCLAAAVPNPVDTGDSIPDEWLGYALSVDHTDAACGAITVAMDGVNSVYTRTFVVQYDEKVITTLEDKLEVKCVFDPNNVLLESSVLKLDETDLTGLKSSTVEGQFNPATLIIESGGTVVDPAIPLVIGAEVEFTFQVPAEYGAIKVLEGTASNNDDGDLKTLKLVTSGCMDADAFHLTVATPARDATNKIVTMTIKIFQFYGFTDVKFEFTVRVCLTSDTAPCDAETCGSGTQFGRRKREAQTFNETLVEGAVTVMNPVQFKEYEQRKAEAECGTSKEITAAMIIMGIVILTLLTLSLILIAKIAISRKSRAQSKQDLYSAGSVQSMPQI